MGKIIFWLVIIFAVLLVLRLVNVAQSRNRRDAARAAKGSQQQDAMIRCVDCGVYLPSADAKAGPRGPLCGDPQCARRASRSGE